VRNGRSVSSKIVNFGTYRKYVVVVVGDIVGD